jgi:hypothetical protein
MYLPYSDICAFTVWGNVNSIPLQLLVLCYGGTWQSHFASMSLQFISCQNSGFLETVSDISEQTRSFFVHCQEQLPPHCADFMLDFQQSK